MQLTTNSKTNNPKMPDHLKRFSSSHTPSRTVHRSENITSPLINKDKQIGNIYETSDYSKFKFFAMNRELNRYNILKLKHSISIVGQLQNVLVDKDFNVAEGQHRIHALQELGLPVRYEIRSNIDIQKIQQIQQGTPWKTFDYMKSYSVAGESNPNSKAYQLYKQFTTDYKLGHNMSLALLCGTYSNTVPTDDYKNGTLKINPEQYELARTQAGMISQLGKFYKNYKKRAFILAVFTLIKKVKGYNHQRMISQLEKYRNELYPSSKAVHYVQNLLRIYNKWLNQSEKISIRDEDVISGT